MVIIMAKLWFSLMLLGPTAAFILTVPKSSVSIPARSTAWLSALLSRPTSLPHYFQIRWYFVTGSKLVLMLKADNCKANGTNQHWRDSCKIRIEKTEGYKHRAEVSSDNVSLMIQDVRAEDSGIYSIMLLALGVKLSANINLIVTNEDSTSSNQTESCTRTPLLTFVSTDVEVSVSSVKAANIRDHTVPNIIQLSLAGLILLLLGVIIVENISFTYCMNKKMSVRDGRETISSPTGMECSLPPLPLNPSMFVKMPGSDEFHCIIGH
ncbi:uncharacterized protein LOC100563243 isoform X6 [Anolis carolinensis]|uniref:uncharacterized protein LOC100563243 isoform X6 n=1 Tax=Anolis carolinensis TaxID=28377 RepID=UPI002F2B8813